MLTRSFCLLSGIGPTTERKLWKAGVHTWDDFLAADAALVSAARKAAARPVLEECRERLEACDADYFADRLPASEHWRLFLHFGTHPAYVDIETTGLAGEENHITAIAYYDGSTVRTYTHARDLHRFEEDVATAKLLVTFNGKCFDAPILEKELGLRLPRAHVDLRYVLKQLGYRGGLKACEKSFGLCRDELDGVDGYFAVLLWRLYQAEGDPRALETLLAYNAADVIGLETLLVAAINRKLEDTPFYADFRLPDPTPPENPHKADERIIRRLRGEHPGQPRRFW